MRPMSSCAARGAYLKGAADLTQIGYLAHDLSDPAIARRERMLRAGGASTRMAGFVRAGRQVPSFAGGPAPLVLGRTQDARLAARALLVGRSAATRMDDLAAQFEGVDVLIARNLEMLVLAARLKRRMARAGSAPRLVYECLDIHRLLTAPSPAGRALRLVERLTAGAVDLVLTSSPAFVERHLGAAFPGRTLLVENKVFVPPGATPEGAPPTPAGPPWRIGWFGALRCRKSLDILSALADRCEGRVEVILRGMPARDVFPDLEAEVAQKPHIRFEDAYDAGRDLPEIYGEVQFAWCIDYFEEGGNSAWLLPNRLYESAFHGTVPIALAAVETGAFLRRRDCGVTLGEAPKDDLLRLFRDLTPQDYRMQLDALARQPRRAWSADAADCAALVRALTADPAGAPAPSAALAAGGG